MLSDDGHGCERWKGYGGAAAGALDDDGHDYERQRHGDGAPAPMRDCQWLRDHGRGWRAWRARAITSLPFSGGSWMELTDGGSVGGTSGHRPRGLA